MNRYIVVGDSYAQLDSEHSHWFKLWCEQREHSVQFAGLPGGNHINISAHLRSIDVSQFCGVVYHFTSLLRGEGIRMPCDARQRDSSVIDLMNLTYEQHCEWIDHCLSSDVSDSVLDHYHAQNVIPYFFNPVDGVDTASCDSLTVDMSNRFYRAVSPRWLIRANWLAFENAMLYLTAMNVPVIVALPPCGGFDFVQSRLVQPGVEVWNMSAVKQLNPLPHSNHISYEHAQFFSEEFEKSGSPKEVLLSKHIG